MTSHTLPGIGHSATGDEPLQALETCSIPVAVSLCIYHDFAKVFVNGDNFVGLRFHIII